MSPRPVVLKVRCKTCRTTIETDAAALVPPCPNCASPMTLIGARATFEGEATRD